MNIDLANAVLKVAAGSVLTLAVAAPAVPSFSPAITVDYIGVPLNVVVACAAGAYSSFSFGDKVEPRSRMYQLFIACIIMGCAMTGLTNALIGYWLPKLHVSSGGQAALGAFVSCLARFVIPAIIERIGPLMDRIPFFRKTPKGE